MTVSSLKVMRKTRLFRDGGYREPAEELKAGTEAFYRYHFRTSGLKAVGPAGRPVTAEALTDADRDENRVVPRAYISRPWHMPRAGFFY